MNNKQSLNNVETKEISSIAKNLSDLTNYLKTDILKGENKLKCNEDLTKKLNLEVYQRSFKLQKSKLNLDKSRGFIEKFPKLKLKSEKILSQIDSRANVLKSDQHEHKNSFDLAKNLFVDFCNKFNLINQKRCNELHEKDLANAEIQKNVADLDKLFKEKKMEVENKLSEQYKKKMAIEEKIDIIDKTNKRAILEQSRLNYKLIDLKKIVKQTNLESDIQAEQLKYLQKQLIDLENIVKTQKSALEEQLQFAIKRDEVNETNLNNLVLQDTNQSLEIVCLGANADNFTKTINDKKVKITQTHFLIEKAQNNYSSMETNNERDLLGLSHNISDFELKTFDLANLRNGLILLLKTYDDGKANSRQEKRMLKKEIEVESNSLKVKKLQNVNLVRNKSVIQEKKTELKIKFTHLKAISDEKRTVLHEKTNALKAELERFVEDIRNFKISKEKYLENVKGELQAELKLFSVNIKTSHKNYLDKIEELKKINETGKDEINLIETNLSSRKMQLYRVLQEYNVLNKEFLVLKIEMKEQEIVHAKKRKRLTKQKIPKIDADESDTSKSSISGPSLFNIIKKKELLNRKQY